MPALQEGAGQAAKPGSVWPSSPDILLPQLSNNRSSWQASPSCWRWWLDQLASWRALLGDRARPRSRVRSCSPPLQGWAGWRRVTGDLSSLEKQVKQTNATIGARAVIQLASLLLLMFTKQQKGVLQPPSSLPDHSFIVFSTKLRCSSV